jgi:ParB family transcriptional regulator, chromosome partitioning protein
MPANKTTAKKTTAKTTRKTTRKRRGPAEARGPEPTQSAIATDDAEIGELVAHIHSSRGAVIGAYRDPYGGTPLVFATLPVGAVEATSFQRDLSRTHAERLATAIGDTGAFLDPVIAIPSKEGFLSPNGRHRIAAARQLGQRSITVLATADRRLPIGSSP